MTKTNFKLPSVYSEYIYVSRYSRYLWEENRRETWTETVDRYINFFKKQTQGKIKVSDPIWNELRNAIGTLQVMPSMRALMTAGEALERDHVAGYNCFGGKTKVLTLEDGVVDIELLAGKSRHVLTSNKIWELANFSCFGEQELKKLTLGYNNNRNKKEILVTENHNWILSDGTRKTTAMLRKGDSLPFNRIERNVDPTNKDYRLGIIHGLIYGDGTATYKKEHREDRQVNQQERIKGYMIRLCGDYEDLLPYFENYKKSYPESFNGDPMVYLYDDFSKTHRLKELPDTSETDEYMIGFFRGWMAADGYVSKNGEVSICVSGLEEIWIRRYMPRVGFILGGSKLLPEYTNFGKRNVDSRCLGIFRPSLTSEDFLIKRKADRFSSFDYDLRFVSLEDTGIKEKVYCATVDSTGDFTLDHGILTGNCAYLAVDNARAFDEILYILMCGTGVGFSVEQKYVEQLPTIAEDFYDTDTTIVVVDSKLGWAKAFKELIHLLYGGQVPKFDTSKVRKAGEPLRTFGGRASGPEPLENLVKFAIKLFKNASGRKLTTLEAHDLVCMIAVCVVVGGVRRCCKDTYDIYTDSGWKNIKDVNVGDYVIINGERVAVKANINNGIQQTVNVNMEDGTTHICTPEHRWFVYDHATETTQWKTTEELKNGRFSMLKPKSTLP